MKKIILIAVLLISFASANSQSNYTYIAQRYRWLAGLFEALGLPAGSGPAAFAAGQNQRAGQVYYDSSGIDQGVYVWTGLTWQLIGGGSQTLQQVFNTEVGGSVLTKNDTVLLSGFNLTIKGPGTTQYDFQPTQFNFLNQNAGSSTQLTGTAGGGLDAVANFAGTNNGSNLNLSDGFARLNAQNTLGPESNVYVYPDSIALAPQGGALKFRGIVSGAGTAGLRYNPSTNAVTYDTSSNSTSTLRIARGGAGEPTWFLRTADTTLVLKDIIGAGGITVSTLADSTLEIDGSGIGGGVWGSITGTLSSQTDLQTALDARVSSVTTVGTGPNANGATITAGVLQLQPASTSFAGVVTTGTQSFAGDKTWTGTPTFSGGFRTNSTPFQSNLIVIGAGASGTTSQAELQLGGATTTGYRVAIRGGTATVLPTNGSSANFIIGNNSNSEATSGTHPLLANGALLSNNYTNAAGSTTDATTLYVQGAPTGITPTNPATALWVASGPSRFGGNISLDLTRKIEIATGSNASIGTSTLVAGTVTVSTTAVTASSKIYLTVGVVGGTQGFLSVGTITAGTSFVINSTSATETSDINWWIIN